MNAPRILVVPDRRLRAVAAPVTDLAAARRLAGDMALALGAARGLGLAAPQVGAGLRLVLVSAHPGRPDPGYVALANPRVVWASGEVETRAEGCLSIPGGRWDVTRPSSVRVAYEDLDGVPGSWEAEGLVAACLQHEIDHLDGHLIIDGLSRTRRAMAERRAAKVGGT